MSSRRSPQSRMLEDADHNARVEAARRSPPFDEGSRRLMGRPRRTPKGPRRPSAVVLSGRSRSWSPSKERRLAGALGSPQSGRGRASRCAPVRAAASWRHRTEKAPLTCPKEWHFDERCPDGPHDWTDDEHTRFGVQDDGARTLLDRAPKPRRAAPAEPPATRVDRRSRSAPTHRQRSRIVEQRHARRSPRSAPSPRRASAAHPHERVCPTSSIASGPRTARVYSFAIDNRSVLLSKVFDGREYPGPNESAHAHQDIDGPGTRTSSAGDRPSRRVARTPRRAQFVPARSRHQGRTGAARVWSSTYAPAPTTRCSPSFRGAAVAGLVSRRACLPTDPHSFTCGRRFAIQPLTLPSGMRCRRRKRVGAGMS